MASLNVPCEVLIPPYENYSSMILMRELFQTTPKDHTNLSSFAIYCLDIAAVLDSRNKPIEDGMLLAILTQGLDVQNQQTITFMKALAASPDPLSLAIEWLAEGNIFNHE